MRRWPVREPRLTAAASRGWLRCGTSSCCGSRTTEFQFSSKVNLDRRTPNVDGLKKHEILNFVPVPPQPQSSDALACLSRLHSENAAVFSRNCSGYMALGSSKSMQVSAPFSAASAPFSAVQSRMLHSTPQFRRYFDEDFAAPGIGGEKGIRVSSKEDKHRRLSKVTTPPSPTEDTSLSADTLRSITLAKQLLKGDRSPGLGVASEHQSSLELSHQRDGFRPAHHGEVAASGTDSFQPAHLGEEYVSGTNGRAPGCSNGLDQPRSLVSGTGESSNSISESEVYSQTTPFQPDESCPKILENSVFTRDGEIDDGFSSPSTELTASVSPSLAFSSISESSHNSNELSEPVRTLSLSSADSSSSSPTEALSEYDPNYSSTYPWPSHEETITPQEQTPHISMPSSADSTDSAFSWNSSDSSFHTSEEDSSPYSSQAISNTANFASMTANNLPALPYAEHIASAACTSEELASVLQETVLSPPDSRVLKVAVLGLPNAGKSSIINALTQDQVCTASRKVHTTRSVAKASVTIGRTQLVFLDTPGVVTPEAAHKHNLPPSLVRGSEEALAEADLLLLVVDVATRYAKLGLHSRILRILALHPNTPAVLCVNKVDLVKKKTTLLELAKEFTEGTVGGVSSHTDSHLSPPKPRDPFRSPNKTPQELVDEFLDNLEEQKKERENSYKALPAEENMFLLASSKESDPVVLENHLDETPLELEEPVLPENQSALHENQSLSSAEKQEENSTAERKPIEELVRDLFEDESSPDGSIVPTAISAEDIVEVDETEDFSIDGDWSTSALTTDLSAARASSIMPLHEAAELTFSVSFEELQANDYLYVAPPLGSALDACRPPLPFTEEDVLQGRVKLSEDQAKDFVKDKKGWPLFQEVVFTSVNCKKGINPLRELLLRRAKPAAWVYSPSLSTDQDPRQLVMETVRAKFMDRMKYSLPYELQYSIERWERGGGDMLHIGVRITCRKDRVAKIVVGARGHTVVCVAKEAEADLVKTFKKDVNLHLSVISEESLQRAAVIAEERKLIQKGSTPEEAQLIVKGMQPELLKRQARILKHKGVVYHRSVGGLVFRREQEN